MALDVAKIRRHFPILQETLEGNPLIYFDTAATSQKPQVVIDAIKNFYETENSNVHRGMHVLAERATVAYEEARNTVQRFLNAKHPEEIIFTKGCTESINLVAKSWAKTNLQKGDAIVLSILEHHSNIVPWLQLKEEMDIEVQWIDMDDHGHLKLEQLDAFLAEGNVKLVSITGLSNVLGVRPPLPEIIEKAHAAGALVLVDASQLVTHHPIDVQSLDCDFLAFSGHKIFGPTGIGVLYAKREHLESMSPWLGGGMMIREVRKDGYTPADIPQKFEGGTPPIAQAVGLHAAIDWLSQFSWEDIEQHEQNLLSYAFEKLQNFEGLTILGPAERSGCISFVIDDMHPHDLTEILGRKGICLRAGHHCTQPLHERLGHIATTRLSVSIYNTKEEIDIFCAGIQEAQSILQPKKQHGSVRREHSRPLPASAL